MKIKNKLLRILSLVLIITMLLPSNVYADKVNGGGSDSSGGIGSGSDKGDNCSPSWETVFLFLQQSINF